VHADEKLSAFVELERQGVNRDVLSRIHQSLIPRGERSGLWDARRGELLKLSIARSRNR
jgi:hypothetical protein